MEGKGPGQGPSAGLCWDFVFCGRAGGKEEEDRLSGKDESESEDGGFNGGYRGRGDVDIRKAVNNS